jgi:poly [ADP-ribose] polymerase
MKNPIELIMVSGENNNKFYRMKDLDDGTFTVEYGRVGVTSQTESYPISRWDSKYKEKLKKGYRDVSDLKVEGDSGEFSFEDTSLELFYKQFSKYTKDNVGRNYTIAVGAVTKAMIDEAQSILNFLVGTSDIDKFNKYLLELYTVLPRRMSNVKDYLVQKDEQFKGLIGKEQDVLDSLSSSVVVSTGQKEGVSFLDSLGISMELLTDAVELKRIEDLINPSNTSKHKIYKVFKVGNQKRVHEFNYWLEKQDNKRVDLLIHGTRNPNCFSILKTGLLVRPTNAVSFAGSVYGNGVYHSSHADKSLGYTGYDSDKLFFLQEVHMGNPFEYKGWYTGNSFRLEYSELKSRGFDSTYVSAGNGLRNSEYIVYNSEQTNSKYLVWLK